MNPEILIYTTSIISFLMAIFATKRVFTLYSDAAVPAWLIFVWLCPLIGSGICFLYNPVPAEVPQEVLDLKAFCKEQPHRKHLNAEEREELFAQWKKERAKSETL